LPTSHDEVPTRGESIPSVQPSPIHNVFFGSDGLRAGWSLLLFAALFATFLFSASYIVRKIHPPAHHPANSDFSVGFMLINELVPLFVTLLATWIMSKIEHRPTGVYGLSFSRRFPLLFAGLGWGIVCLTPLIFALWKAGFLVFDRRLLFGADILRYGSGWLLGFFTVGMFEEYFTRGYILYTLNRGLAGFYKWAFKTPHSNAFAFWTSAVILSLLFGFAHGSNSGESPIGLLTAFLASIVFCLSLWRTGSLWWAIGFHTTWDWGQSFLYGVSDSGIMAEHHLFATHPVGKLLLSGGATGPEGSIFVLGPLALIAVVILLTIRRTHAGYTPLHNQETAI
jgi:membrane protease YdiL (CAAX protease family)